MMQAKKTIKQKEPKKLNKQDINLQQKFLSLSKFEQMGVTCFFNAHNVAHYIYEGLSEEAKSYVTYCIHMSEQADKIEEKNESAQVS